MGEVTGAEVGLVAGVDGPGETVEVSVGVGRKGIGNGNVVWIGVGAGVFVVVFGVGCTEPTPVSICANVAVG